MSHVKEMLLRCSCFADKTRRMTHSEGNILLFFFFFFTRLTHEVNLPINLPTLETGLDSHRSDKGREAQGS